MRQDRDGGQKADVLGWRLHLGFVIGEQRLDLVFGFLLQFMAIVFPDERHAWVTIVAERFIRYTRAR